MTTHIHHASSVCCDGYHRYCDGLLDVFIKALLPGDVADQVAYERENCGCFCHPIMSGFCADGIHGRCNAFSPTGSQLCDCPCHFRRARADVLDLRLRVIA